MPDNCSILGNTLPYMRNSGTKIWSKYVSNIRFGLNEGNMAPHIYLGLFIINKSGKFSSWFQFSPFGAEKGIIQVNTMANDVLTPCITRTSTTLRVNMQDKHILFFHEEEFQLPVPFSVYELIVNTNTYLSRKNSMTKVKSNLQYSVLDLAE